MLISRNFIDQIWQSAKFFLEKHFSIRPNSFSNCYIQFCELNRGNFFSGYRRHGNQENGVFVFVVSMTTVVKGRKLVCLFQKANVGKYSPRISDQSNHYFLRKNVPTCPIVPCYWSPGPQQHVCNNKKVGQNIMILYCKDVCDEKPLLAHLFALFNTYGPFQS